MFESCGSCRERRTGPWVGGRQDEHRVGAFDHPHVCQRRPLLAGIREGVAKLLGESQVVAAAEVPINFLKTVDPIAWLR